MKKIINLILSLIKPSVKPDPEIIIYELHEYRNFINGLNHAHIIQSLINASRGQRDLTFYRIEKWAATAMHYRSCFTDKVLVERYESISKIKFNTRISYTY